MTLHQTLHHPGPYTTTVQKVSEHRICQKTKRERKEERFGPTLNNCSTASGGKPIIPSRAFANVLTCCWTTYWTIDGYRSKVLFLSLPFCLLTKPVLRTFWYHCCMALMIRAFWCNVFWEVFLQASEKDGDRTMNVSIEPFPHLIWFMTMK